MRLLYYTGKILKITHLPEDSRKLTSPYRKSKELPATYYGIYMETEIISVEGYDREPTRLGARMLRFLRRSFRMCQTSRYKVKTSLITTIAFRSSKEAERYAELTEIGVRSQEFETEITLFRLTDLDVGALIIFSYPDPESGGEDHNLIRYQNEPLTINDFERKLDTLIIDNTLEDSAIRYGSSFIGLCRFKKIKTPEWKRKLKARCRFLIDIKHALFYKKRSTLQKVGISIVVIITIVSIFYDLNSGSKNEQKSLVIAVIMAFMGMLKEFFS